MRKSSTKLGNLAAQIGEHSTLSVLIFTVNGKEYAFPVKPIQEIINCNGYSDLPADTNSAHGVVSLRGVGVPVFDFGALLSSTSTKIGKRSCIIIIEVDSADDSQKKHSFGLLVDCVSVVREIESEKIEDAPRFGEKSSNDLFTGMLQLDGKFILIMNEGKLYSRLEFQTNDNAKIKKVSM